MKGIIGFIGIIFFALMSQAQVAFTVTGASGASVHRTLDSALYYAQNGDTIYMPGGTFSVGVVLINKRLCLYGAGHYPDSSIATGRTVLNGSIRLVSGASQSVLQGLYLSGRLNFGSNPTDSQIDGVTIARCNLEDVLLAVDDNYSSLATNILFRENVIRSPLNLRYAKDILIENNILNTYVANASGSVLLKNNLFFGNSYTVYYLSSCVFESNIFYVVNGLQYASGSNTYRNNVFRSDNQLVGSDVSENNLFNVSNLFVNQTLNVFDYIQNYHLNAGSPAIGAGKSGTDCGIYGGAKPYKNSAVPANPHVQTKTIAESTDAAGKINVQVKVAAQNN